MTLSFNTKLSMSHDLGISGSAKLDSIGLKRLFSRSKFRAKAISLICTTLGGVWFYPLPKCLVQPLLNYTKQQNKNRLALQFVSVDKRQKERGTGSFI